MTWETIAILAGAVAGSLYWSLRATEKKRSRLAEFVADNNLADAFMRWDAGLPAADDPGISGGRVSGP